MLLKQPKTIITLNIPFHVGQAEYVAMDYDGCHFTRKEFNKLQNSPYAIIITEEQYCAQIMAESHQQLKSHYYYPEQQTFQYEYYDMPQ